jgi:hypothetical protein
MYLSFHLPSSKCVRACGAVAVGFFAFSSTQTMAQQVPGTQKVTGDSTLQAIVKEVGTWSSNPLMVVDGATSLWGSTTSPELIYKSSTPLAQANVDTRIDESVFNQSSFDTTDITTTGGFIKNTQRWMAGLQGTLAYDTTRTSELTNYNLQPILSRHLGISLAPKIGFSPNATDTVALAGSAAISQYDKDIFTNYDTFTLTPSYNHKFDQQNTGIFSFQAQQYQTTRDNAEKVDSLGPSIGWQTIISPRIQANASVGAQMSREYDFGAAVDPWTLDYVFSGGLTFKGVQDNLNVAVGRSEFPYGNGTQGLQTTFSVAESHVLNPLLTLNLGASYLTSEYQKDVAGDLKSLADGHGGLAYHVTDYLDLTADYHYRYETLTNITKNVQDNAAIVGLTYHPNMWTLAD